jgi:transposase
MAEIDDLFQAALGLVEPWQVTRSEFDATARRLDLYLDFPKGARFACPEGDAAAACAVHDSSDKTWRHLDFFQHQAYLHARVPRVSCPTHGVRQVRLAWARPESGFTLLFEALLMAMLAEMPVRAVADLVGEHDTRLWRLLHHHVEAARAKVSMAEVTRVGVDETAAKRGQDYVSLFVDLDAPKPRVLFATEGRDHSTVERFAEDLTAHGGDPAGVRDVSADMSPAFERGVRASLPKAYLTYDRYHLVSHATKAVDEVRRAEAKTHPELKGTRYVWLKRPEHLTVKQAATLQGLTPASVGLGTARAYRWRLAFDAFFDQPRELAEDYLEDWYQGAIRSRLDPIIDFAHMIGEHWEGVLRWHWTRINNGVLEGINSLVQAAKRRARGYRNKRNLIAMIYLIAGRLDFSPTHTN